MVTLLGMRLSGKPPPLPSLPPAFCEPHLMIPGLEIAPMLRLLNQPQEPVIGWRWRYAGVKAFEISRRSYVI